MPLVDERELHKPLIGVISIVVVLLMAVGLASLVEIVSSKAMTQIYAENVSL